MSYRYPQITPLHQSTLFKFEPDCYSEFVCSNVEVTGNNDMSLSSIFSSEMYSPYIGYDKDDYSPHVGYEKDMHSPHVRYEQGMCSSHVKDEQDMYNLPRFTVLSNTSPYSSAHFSSELQLSSCSPGLSARNSSPTTFDISHVDSLNSPTQFIPDMSFANLVTTNAEDHLIIAKPTSRALKAKRCPINRCGCGGKKNCVNPLCVKAVGCFSCPVCGIEFSRKNSMRRHVLTHINLRPYECQECEKSFYRSDIYKRHLLSKRCKRNLSRNLPNTNCP